MKYLLQRFGFFIFILILIKVSFVVFYGDKFTYQTPQAVSFRNQVQYRKNVFAKQDFNTVFIGSSRTALGISPAYFDSLTANKTNSYNFGIIGGTPPLTFDLCDELIQTNSSLKYIFFELGGEYIDSAKYDNWLLTFFKPSIPRAKSEEATFNLPLQNIPLEEFLNKKEKQVSKSFSLQKVQFRHSLNLEVEQEDSEVSIDENYWNKISDLIKSANLKQIQIYFLIPPRLASEDELGLVHPIYHRVEDKYKLKVAHYDETLYQIETSLDNSHLNYRGSKIFTELMAEAFNKKNF